MGLISTPVYDVIAGWIGGIGITPEMPD